MNATRMQMQKYIVECAKKDYPSEDFIAIWRRLLSEGTSPEKIYQTPEFYDYLHSTNDGDDQVELLSIKVQGSAEIVSIVPIRFRRQAFEFGFGGKIFAAPSIQTITILGTLPLLPLTAGLFEELLKFLFEQYPLCSAVSMPACPFDSAMRIYLHSSTIFPTRYQQHVLHGWRESHVIPIPETFEQYLFQFSAKKRFNLNRQVRLLREHFDGELRLKRIELPAEVPFLIRARNSITPHALTANLLSERKFLGLAEHGLLLSYALVSGEKACAVILATRSDKVLHIHNILYDEKLMRLSVGASILHMVMEDLTNHFELTSIDLGYSNPTHNHQSSNLVEMRGHMLILRKTWRNRFLCFLHELYEKQLKIIKNIVETRRRKKKETQKLLATK